MFIASGYTPLRRRVVPGLTLQPLTRAFRIMGPIRHRRGNLVSLLNKSNRGSVRARASRYNLCSRTCGDVPLRGFQDGQHRHGAAEKLESAASGGNVLMVAGAEAEKVAQFIVSATEPSGWS